VPFPKAADRMGWSTDTLHNWHEQGHLPAVKSPGGHFATFESFIRDVLASARPGEAGDIEKIARAWFARHAPTEAIA
jgi:hypothetical protein